MRVEIIFILIGVEHILHAFLAEIWSGKAALFYKYYTAIILCTITSGEQTN